MLQSWPDYSDPTVYDIFPLRTFTDSNSVPLDLEGKTIYVGVLCNFKVFKNPK